MIFSRYCELLCCCCFPASSACKTTDKIVISLVLRRQMNYRVGQILTKKTSASWRRHSRFFYHLQGETVWFSFFVFDGCFLVPPLRSSYFIVISMLLQSRIKLKSFTFMQRANFSLAPGKSPACRRANPAAPHTPEGSSPHLVETSIASESRSASINRSRRRLQQTNKNYDQIQNTLSPLF